VLEGLRETYPLSWQAWYLDDGIFFGDAAHVEETFRALQEQLAARGLQINCSKCELWGPGASQWNGPPVRVVPWAPQHGVTVLGVPVNFPGSTAYAEMFWGATTDKLQAALDRVTKLVDSQCAHHLLRKCLDGCKVTHLLRASDTYTSDAALRRCDEAILTAFEDILGTYLAPHQRVQAGHPLKVGGCGIRCPLVVRPAARISALARFYSTGSLQVGVPECARRPCDKGLNPVLVELQATLGINFDPVTGWLGRHDLIFRRACRPLKTKVVVRRNEQKKP